MRERVFDSARIMAVINSQRWRTTLFAEGFVADSFFKCSYFWLPKGPPLARTAVINKLIISRGTQITSLNERETKGWVGWAAGARWAGWVVDQAGNWLPLTLAGVAARTIHRHVNWLGGGRGGLLITGRGYCPHNRCCSNRCSHNEIHDIGTEILLPQ